MTLDARNDAALDSLGPMLSELGVRSKVARRLDVGGRPIGIVCVDQTEESSCWSATDVEYLDVFATRVLAPIQNGQMHARPAAREIGALTAAEGLVARLASEGLSYKAIAQRLRKSPNTVDNQLRSIRAKLRVRNQVELALACDGMMPS